MRAACLCKFEHFQAVGPVSGGSGAKKSSDSPEIPCRFAPRRLHGRVYLHRQRGCCGTSSTTVSSSRMAISYFWTPHSWCPRSPTRSFSSSGLIIIMGRPVRVQVNHGYSDRQNRLVLAPSIVTPHRSTWQVSKTTQTRSLRREKVRIDATTTCKPLTFHHSFVRHTSASSRSDPRPRRRRR